MKDKENGAIKFQYRRCHDFIVRIKSGVLLHVPHRLSRHPGIAGPLPNQKDCNRNKKKIKKAIA
jgi:hypothetical protein